MLKKLPIQPQLEMFKTVLESFINPKHELCLLAKETGVNRKKKYSDFGKMKCSKFGNKSAVFSGTILQ